MNIAITGNPYDGENVVISTRGVTTDAKVAKLNNTTKRPVLVANWEKGRPSVKVSEPEPSFSPMTVTPRDYSDLLGKIGISAVEHAKVANNEGAKKLRVNKIVNTKSSNIYNNVSRSQMTPTVSVTPEEEVKNLINQINVVPEPVEVKKEVPLNIETHGRHESTGEVPIDDIRDAIRKEMSFNPTSVVSSRMEKNAFEHESMSRVEEAPKQEPKAGDIDLYNNLLHNAKEDDVSRQLQGAKNQLSIEKEESKKLAEQYGRAVRELEELKEDIESKKRIKAQQEKRELTETLNNIETLKRENLERTSDLSSIQAEIARLKAEREAMDSNMYTESRPFGRRAA